MTTPENYKRRPQDPNETLVHAMRSHRAQPRPLNRRREDRRAKRARKSNRNWHRRRTARLQRLQKQVDTTVEMVGRTQAANPHRDAWAVLPCRAGDHACITYRELLEELEARKPEKD